MSVLESIIEGVKEDLERRKLPLGQIKERATNVAPAHDVLPIFQSHKFSIISEVKRSSPSKGALAPIADPAGLAELYQEGGAAAISVLTEERRFGGTLADLDAVRAKVTIPILRKDFMVDEYQFYEARAHGADIVLLIVAGLARTQIADYAALTRELGMRALVEIHTASELEVAMEIESEIIGVNARNLKTLDVDASAFADLMPRIPQEVIKVAESGISTQADIDFAIECGADVALIGEALVRSGDPKSTLRQFLERG